MDKLLERPFAGEQYGKERVSDRDDSVEEGDSDLLQRPRHIRETGSVALNAMLRLHGRLDSRYFQNEITSAPTEDATHDSL